MALQKEGLRERLVKANEMTIRVTGRKSGRVIEIPVWFVLEGEKVYLLPVSGSDTQWYKNVLKNPKIGIVAGGAKGEFRAIPIAGGAPVSAVVEKFRKKYGAGDVKKYYSKFDVAVAVEMS
jgi:hypothetical protein